MKIHFPGFYHPKDNITFVNPDSKSRYYRLIKTEVDYNYLTKSFSRFFYTGIDIEDNTHRIFPRAKVIPIGSPDLTILVKEINLPEGPYPNFLMCRYRQQLQVFPTYHVTFCFSRNPPFEIELHTNYGSVDLNTRGEIINKHNQEFIKWL